MDKEKQVGKLDDLAAAVAHAMDQSLCEALRAQALISQNIGKENFIANLHRAIAYMNTPDYYLLSHPMHQAVINDLVKDADLKIKVLYSDCVRETELFLVKQDAFNTNGAFAAPYYVENNILRSMELIVNPEAVRLFRLR